jgi:hypothetical protein
MTHGKETCKILKKIRQQIADKNEIEYTTSECSFKGECTGTCPKCEAELKYIENELHKRKQLGKIATIAGISLGIASTFSACNNAPKQTNIYTSEQGIPMEDEVILTGILLPPSPPPPSNTIMAIDDQHVISLESGEIDPNWYNNEQ